MKIGEEVVANPSELNEGLVNSSEKIRTSIIEKLKQLGMDDCPEGIVDNFLIIGENSEFNQDSEMICEAFGNVLEQLEKKNLTPNHLTPEQKNEGLLAAFLHDIGKAGPLTASRECKLSIVKLFSVKNLDTSKHIYVGETLKDFFPDDWEEMLEHLKEVGIGDMTTMRSFWNNHVWWTHSILKTYPDIISNRVDLIASSHHISSGENPCDISEDEVPEEAMTIGALEHYVDFLEERTLMIIDKYQAAIVRGQVTHENAMSYLRNVFHKYEKDGVTNSIIGVIDELGKQNKLFPNTKSNIR